MRGGRALPSRAREPFPQSRRSRGASAVFGLPAESVLERQLQTGAREISGLDISSAQVKTLSAYCRLISRWNRSYNLVSARTLPEIVPRHILDALSLFSFLPSAACRILDLGTGAGLPGLPLAVVHPECRFTLLDRSRKKTRFVRQAKLDLGLPNVEIVTGDAAHYRADPFQCIVARAVGPVAGLVRCSRHLIAAGGVYLLPKGSEVEPELQGLPQGWDAEIESIKNWHNRSLGRTVVVLRPPGTEAEAA